MQRILWLVCILNSIHYMLQYYVCTVYCNNITHTARLGWKTITRIDSLCFYFISRDKFMISNTCLISDYFHIICTNGL